jgi:hypothetical protein
MLLDSVSPNAGIGIAVGRGAVGIMVGTIDREHAVKMIPIAINIRIFHSSSKTQPNLVVSCKKLTTKRKNIHITA